MQTDDIISIRQQNIRTPTECHLDFGSYYRELVYIDTKSIMTVDGRRPRLLRRLFPPKHVSDEASFSRRPLPGQKTSNVTTDEKQEEKGSPSKVNSSVVGKSGSSGLWSEVYSLFAASTASPDLKAVAKLLREQSSTDSSLTTKQSDNGANASREWHLCRDVLHMAEERKSELENKTEQSLMRQLRKAYAEIVTWTQKFVALGDIISQVDPVHIGLPWAGVRALLIVRAYSFIQGLHRSCWLPRRSLSMIRKRKPRSLPDLHISPGSFVGMLYLKRYTYKIILRCRSHSDSNLRLL